MDTSLILVDMGSIFWQSWHSSKNEEVSTARDSSISKISKMVNPNTTVVVCVDSPPYKRKEYYAEYKGTRSPVPENAKAELNKTIEQLDEMGFSVLRSPGLEADDIIATIVHQMQTTDLRKKADDIEIVSSDKDLSQLLAPNITQTSPITRETYTVNSIVERYGVMPAEIEYLLALMGDSADNIPGVQGIGPKIAATLINEHGWETLLEILDCGDPDEVIHPAGTRKKLLEQTDNLLLSHRLVTLVKDAPIDVAEIFEPKIPQERKEAEPVGSMDEPETGSESMDDKGPADEPSIINKTPHADAPADTDTGGPVAITKAGPPSAAIVVKSTEWSLRLEPTSAQSAFEMAKHFHRARIYSKFPTQESIFAIIMRGRSLGLDATTALDAFHLVENQPTMSAPLIAGLILRSTLCDFFECIETSDKFATYATHRRGSYSKDPKLLTYTIEEAEQAGLLALTKKGYETNWHKRPKTMLRWRCAVELGRMEFPDIVKGLYTVDEISNGEYTESDFENVG